MFCRLIDKLCTMQDKKQQQLGSNNYSNMITNRGSEWRKWDLHVHSPYTQLNKYSCSDEEFISRVKEQNISVIGLTNYFKFEEEEYLLKEKATKEGITVFLNLELRLSYQNKEDDCCDIHILFDNDLTTENIKDFLTNLKLNLNSSEIKAKDISNYSDGYAKATVELDNLLNALNDESLNLKNRYLIGFLSRGKGNSRTSTNYEKIAKKAHLIIHSSDSVDNTEKDRTFWLKQGKPMLQSSDAHDLTKIGAKFTWVKSQTTFDGLRQIVFEPQERVDISTSKPDDKYGYNLIDYVQFRESEDMVFSSNKIFLNPNLNAIIGGKSTGKSNLLRMIAKDADVEEFKKDKHTIDWITQDIRVQWLSGDDSEKKILYIPQSYLIKDIEDGKRNIADIIVTSLKGDSKRKLLYENIETERNNIKISINSLLDRLFENGRIEKNKKDEIKIIGSKDGLIQEIKKLKDSKTNLLKELKIEEREISEYNDKNELISNILKYIANNEKDVGILNSKISHLELKSFKPLLSDEDLINNLELKDKLNSEFKQIIGDAYDKVISSLHKEIHEALIHSDTFNEQIKNIQKELDAIQQKLIQQTLIYEITAKIEETENKLNQVEELQKEVDNKVSISKEIIDEIFGEFDKYYLNKESFVTEFSFDEDNLRIGYKISFFQSSIYDWFRDNVVNNQTSYLSTLDVSFKEYRFNNNYTQFREQINLLFKEALEGKIPFKGAFTKGSFVKKLLGDWFSLEPVMEYDGDKIEQMSDGKKAFVLLKLLVNIDNSKYPILIDQPEDSLDNRSIYKELTSYLKVKKKQRQIIIVTHNANLVVGADAENIIVANQHGISNENAKNIQFDYLNGALEDSKSFDNEEKIELKKRGIKEHVCEILEGGVDAFKKREQKYSIK